METIELIERAQNGDKESRDKLVTDNIGLVWSIVRRFLGRGYEAEDLFQIGSIGLIKSIDKFDLSYNVRFSTYAVPMITGEIKRFLRDDGMIKVSRQLKENAWRIRLEQERMENRDGKEPTIEELSRELDLAKEEIVMALESGAEVDSLQKIIYQGEGSSILLMDRIEQEHDENEELLNRLSLCNAVQELPQKDRELIIMRYFRDKTQTEIAYEMGISQVQVSRLEKRILERMRKSFIG